MTMFIQLKDGEPFGHAVTEDNLRLLFPTVRFPAVFLPQDVEPHGFGIYEFSQIPELPRFHNLVEGKPVKQENGIYYQNWQFEPMTDAQKSEATSKRADEVRADRNRRLLFSDWTQLPDNALSSDKKLLWTEYRKNLRDISSQQGFPWDIQWPQQPE